MAPNRFNGHTIRRTQETQVDTYTSQEASPGVSEPHDAGSGRIDENGNGAVNSNDDSSQIDDSGNRAVNSNDDSLQVEENGNGTVNSNEDEGSQTGSAEIEPSPSGDDTRRPIFENEPDDSSGTRSPY